MTNGRNNNSFKMPKEHWLPFFAYGFFEEGENTYSKIEDYISNIENKEVNYRSIEKDGVPILIRIRNNDYKTSGYVLRFNDRKGAYKKISEIIIESHLFDKLIWDTIEIDGNKCNALVLKGPEDINLPFFTYGIFKPGEIAFSKIKNYIDIDGKKEGVINYGMKHRDGVPILLPECHEGNKTSGYILIFNDNEAAYKIIDETISERLYYWDMIDTELGNVNVLFGNRPFDGSNEIEDSSDRMNFKGKNDPVFKEGIQLIREYLESEFADGEEDDYEDNEEKNKFFELQMHYMFLWSAIDRYCKLKYNKDNEWENREELLKDELFNNALQNLPLENRYYRPIFTTDDLTERKFNKNKPKWCLNYFYTLRCNIVHRVKTNGWDINLLKEATWDLLDIFEYILKETFKEE